MKKSLLALAAMGAFVGASGVSYAQSSVTVYGTLDASVSNADTGATATNGVTTRVRGGRTVSDRIGFRGVEDLGKGQSAFFQIETGIDPFTQNTGEAGSGDGTAKTSATPGSWLTTRRPTFVGLADKSLGRLSVGSMYSPGFLFTGYGDVAGNNTVGTNFSQATVVSSVADAIATTTTNTTAAYKMNAQSIRYDSPSFNGLVVSAYAVTQTSAASGAGRVNSLSASYTLGKFNAEAVYETKIISTNSGASATPTKHVTSGIGAGYNFGFVNTRLTYQKGELESRIAGAISGSNGVVAVTKLSAIAPVTPQIDIFGAYILLSENSSGTMYGAANVQKSATAMSIGSQYKFSKRTNIYATYTAVENNSNAQFRADGSAISSVAAGLDPKVINVGIRHSF
jgi:predicted porin